MANTKTKAAWADSQAAPSERKEGGSSKVNSIIANTPAEGKKKFDSAEMRRRGRMGGNANVAKYGGTMLGARATRGAWRAYVQAAIAAGATTPADIGQRADALWKLHMDRIRPRAGKAAVAK